MFVVYYQKWIIVQSGCNNLMEKSLYFLKHGCKAEDAEIGLENCSVFHRFKLLAVSVFCGRIIV